MMFCYTECRLCSTYCAFQAMTKKSDKCISSATKKCLERDRDDGLQIAYFVQIFDFKMLHSWSCCQILTFLSSVKMCSWLGIILDWKFLIVSPLNMNVGQKILLEFTSGKGLTHLDLRFCLRGCGISFRNALSSYKLPTDQPTPSVYMLSFQPSPFLLIVLMLQILKLTISNVDTEIRLDLACGKGRYWSWPPTLQVA